VKLVKKILPGAVLLVLLLTLAGCGAYYYGGSYHAYGPSYYRSSWDYDRYYRDRVDHYYDRASTRRAVRREAVRRGSRSPVSRPRPAARPRRR
jgi:hypothetical protein